MDIKINKNFETEYKDDAYKGFSIKECLALLTAAALIGGETFLLWKYAGLAPAEAVYIAMPAVFPVIAWGFYSYQKMSMTQCVKEMLFSRKTSLLVYEAGEAWKEDARTFTTEKKEERNAGFWERKRMLANRRKEMQRGGKTIWQH